MMRQRAKAKTTKTETIPETGATRLQKFLAAAGIASRRESERLIQAGRVEVNGTVVTRLGTKIDPHQDLVRVDGERVSRPERLVYYLLHKPKGCLSSAYDPAGRPTVIDLLRGVTERVFPVGRLDWNSEGLMILTNDGDLALRLTHPRNHVPKVYRVKVKGTVGKEVLEAVRRGLFLDGRKTLPAPADRISSQTNTWVEVVLHEGRRNQLRRVFERLGHPVLKLRRTAIGPITDRELRPGEFRRLSPAEVARLKEAR